uniref:Ig-like domain-containing protein n=1 Tax=Seriola dumerili TaxID=41447 RepID=A0A3B4V1X1_SERDU
VVDGLFKILTVICCTQVLLESDTSTLWRNKGDNATVECSHTKGGSYVYMYWYRQLPGETIKLIVSTTAGNDDHDFGKFSKEKFSATKPDAESGTFTVENLEPGDQGLYFCAVSEHSDTDALGR